MDSDVPMISEILIGFKASLPISTNRTTTNFSMTGLDQ